MFGRLLSRFAKLPAKEDIVSTARAVALALSERDGVTPEQQLAAREDEQKLLAQERARSQALEQQLAAREDEQKLLAQERARSQALQQQLAAREDEQKLLAQERGRDQTLQQQLAAREWNVAATRRSSYNLQCSGTPRRTLAELPRRTRRIDLP